MVFFTFLFPFNTFAKIEVQLVYNVSGTEQSDSTTHTHTHTHMPVTLKTSVGHISTRGHVFEISDIDEL